MIAEDIDFGADAYRAAPGTYTVYRDVAGHRPAGMEATLTVA